MIEFNLRNISKEKILNKIKPYLKYPLISVVVVLLGFSREMLIASNYGLGSELDVFAIVLTLYLFLGTQMGNSFENVIISKMAHKENFEINKVISVVLFFVVSVYATFVIMSYFNLSFFLNAVYPSLNSEQIVLADDLVLVFVVAIIAAVLAGVFKGALYIKEKFVVGMFGGALVSFFTILSILIFSDDYGIVSLAYGYLVGGVFFSLLLYIRMKNTYGFNFNITFGYIVKASFIWKALFIVIIGEVLFQLNFTAQRSVASNIGEGVLSSLYYSMAIVNVMTTLFVSPLTTVLFPGLKRQFSSERVKGFMVLKKYMLIFFMFGVFSSICIFFLSAFIVELAFVRGKFSMSDAIRTSDLLSILVFLLPLGSVRGLMKYGYYSLGYYKAPAVGHVITLCMFLFSAPYLVDAYSEKGLAYSIVLSVAVSTLVLFLTLIRMSKYARM